MKDCHKEGHEAILKQLEIDVDFNTNVEKIAKIFSLLGDATRMKIVLALMKGELCVYHICEITGGSQSAISQHLRKLKDGNILSSKKVGNMVIYKIKDDHVLQIITQALKHKDCI